MEKKIIKKTFLYPMIGHLIINATLLTLVFLDVFKKDLTTFISTMFLSLSIFPILFYNITVKKLKITGDKKIHYGYLATMILFPILFYFAEKQNLALNILIIICFIGQAVYSFYLYKELLTYKEKITNIIKEVKKYEKTRKLLSCLFVLTYIILHLWFGLIKPVYIQTETWMYELIFLGIMTLLVLYVEHKKVKILPKATNYYLTVIILLTYMVVPNLYLGTWITFMSYAILHTISYYALELLGYYDF